MESPIAFASLSWTLVFCALVLLGLLFRLWLNGRQIRYVSTHRSSVPAAFANTIELSAHQKAADYTVAKARFGLIELSVGSTVLIGWTLLGGLDSLNHALLNVLPSGLPQQIALVACFSLISGLIEAPLSWYRVFRLEDRFGFNRMSLGLWLSDGIKGIIVGALIGLPLLALVLWLMDTAGPVWWLWAWGVFVGFNLILLVVYPTWIAPLFNRFTPMNDPIVVERIERLMQRCGFTAKGLFVMDGSKRSAHANAYFTGLGSAKRVVFFDTLLNQLSPNELDAVLAHELGHFKHRHITQRVVGIFAFSLVGFALLGWLSGQLWFYTGLGVTPNFGSSNSGIALILFMSVVPLFTFFLSPLTSALSRRHEFEADAFATVQTNGSDLASALVKLYRDNASTLTPDPLFVKFYYSHPPAGERLARLTR